MGKDFVVFENVVVVVVPNGTQSVVVDGIVVIVAVVYYFRGVDVVRCCCKKDTLPDVGTESWLLAEKRDGLERDIQVCGN